MYKIEVRPKIFKDQPETPEILEKGHLSME